MKRKSPNPWRIPQSLEERGYPPLPEYQEGAVEQLPQDVKNPWGFLQATTPDPTIFNQVRNTTRRRMWNK